MARDNPIRLDKWALGANNVVSEDRLPEGFVRDLINLDPGTGGNLDLRAGYEKVATFAGARACFALGRKAIVVAGNALISYDADTNSTATLRTGIGAGAVAAAELGGTLYLSMVQTSLRTNGQSVAAWGVPAPVFSVQPGFGGLTGRLKVAVTAVVDGVESGATVAVIALQGQGVTVRSADARALRLYVSAIDGETLYFQGNLYGGLSSIAAPTDNSARLETAWMQPMPPVSVLASFRGVLLGAGDRCVYITDPLRPHLVDLSRGFFQYPVTPTMIIACDGGVYISADRVYFLTDPEGEAPSQRSVSEHPAIPGTGVKLPDGRCAWFTRYGQVVGDSLGQVQLLNASKYSPTVAAIGASGYLDQNGNSMVVTTMRGQTESNNLATGDFAELEM